MHTNALSPHSTPSGMTYLLRSPENVPERLRRPVTRKLVELSNTVGVTGDGRTPDPFAKPDDSAVENVTPEEIDLADELNDLLVVALVAEWSLGVPITVDALLDLPKGDYDSLRQTVAPFVTAMLPSFEPTPDADSPTPP